MANLKVSIAWKFSAADENCHELNFRAVKIGGIML